MIASENVTSYPDPLSEKCSVCTESVTIVYLPFVSVFPGIVIDIFSVSHANAATVGIECTHFPSLFFSIVTHAFLSSADSIFLYVVAFSASL